MFRKLVLAGFLVAANATAQQAADITGADFSSGKGDAKLAALGREAAASGKQLVITAPPEWHKSIAAKIRAGGHADVVLREGFYENVLVRVENKPDPAKAEADKAAAEKAAAEKAAARAAAKTAPAATPAPKPAPKSTPTPAPAAVAVPAPAPAPVPVAAPPTQAPKPAAVPTQAPAPPVARAAVAPAAAKPDVAAIRGRFEQSLMQGRSAQGELSADELVSGDLVYADEPVRAIVRRVAGRPELYWLDGDLDLRRSELKVVAPNRYQVVTAIRGDGTLRREFDSKAFVAHVPASDAPARSALEGKYNDGKPIAEQIDSSKLRTGDVVYSGDGVAVVVRREGGDQRRYWLDGELDLGQRGLQKDGTGKYKVVGDLSH